jgi:23S rRNA (uridine2552-2'-O)-methyltransferase
MAILGCRTLDPIRAFPPHAHAKMPSFPTGGNRIAAMAKKNPYKGPDRFTKEAKSAGYPARSVFKLEEIDRRMRLLRPGMRVLDLGASPGSWALYAAQKIGANGRLLAMDLKPLETVLPANSTFLLGDALALTDEQLGLHAPYDVVLSDMAPNTTGNRLGDQTRSFELFMRALAVAARLVKTGGAFVGKIFMGEDFPLARTELRKHFAHERLIRPEGTRSVSYEIFAIGTERRPQPEAARP